MTTQHSVFEGSRMLGKLIAKNGPWLTIEDAAGKHVKARNAKGIEIRESLIASEGLKPAKAAKAPKAPREKKVRKAADPNRVHTVKARNSDRATVVHLERYTKVQTANGNRSYDNGGQVASMLRGLDLDRVYEKVAAELVKAGIEEGDTDSVVVTLRTRYQHLNSGMQRMNLGNRLRAVYPDPEADEEDEGDDE